jgi:amino acid transporter
MDANIIGSAAGSADEALDAGAVGDDEYLAELGYQSGLNRVLGRFSSFAIQYSTIAVVGGMYVTYQAGLIQVGTALIWPWLIAGGLQMVVAMLVAEACSAYPLAGGTYNIVSRLKAKWLGWQTGWWITIAHIASVTANMIGVTPIIAIWLGYNSITHWQLIGASTVLIVLAMLVNLAGVKIASMFNNGGVATELVAAALATVVFAIVLLVTHVHVNSFSALVSYGGLKPVTPILALMYAALLPCYVINGFDISGTVGEETVKASRTVPTGQLYANFGAWIIGAVIILTLSFGLTNVHGAIASGTPFSFVMTPYMGSVVAEIYGVLAVFSLWICSVVLLLAGSRVLYAQARDGELPLRSFFLKLNRERIPVNAVVVSAVIAIALMFWSSLLNILLATTVVLWQGAYAVLLAVMWNARRHDQVPHAPYRVRHWKVLYPIGLIYSVALCGILIYQEPRDVGGGTLGVVLIGLVLYLAYLPAKRARQAREAEAAPGASPGTI